MIGAGAADVYKFAAADSQWDFVNAVISLNEFSVIAQDSNSQDVTFRDDGSKAYIIGSGTDTVYEYDLSENWNLETAVYNGSNFSVVSQENNPRGLFIGNGGTKLFIVGAQNDTVYQYTLSTPWDITSASYDTVSFGIGGQDTSPQGLEFKPDGFEMYMVGNSSDSIHRYTLGTAFDVSTAVLTSSQSVSAQDGQTFGVRFSADGARMFTIGNVNDSVYQYNLSGAWDPTTLTFSSSKSIKDKTTVPTGLALKPDGKAMYIIGTGTHRVFGYETEEVDETSMYVVTDTPALYMGSIQIV